MLSDLFRIVTKAGADEAEAVRGQDPAVQPVRLVLLVGFMLFVRNLLHSYLRQCSNHTVLFGKKADTPPFEAFPLYTLSIMTKARKHDITMPRRMILQKGDPTMIKLSTSMRTYKTNLQGENWRVHFGMRIGMGRYLTDFGIRWGSVE